MGVFSSILDIFRPAKKRVFISYDHSEDRRYRDLLRAWDANSAFDFEFEQCSPNTAINSKQATQIKSSLTKMMRKADYLLVIVGEETHASRWIRWEIARAKKNDMGLKLVAVKIDKSFKTPYGLLNAGTAFAHSFTQAAIIRALEKA